MDSAAGGDVGSGVVGIGSGVGSGLNVGVDSGVGSGVADMGSGVAGVADSRVILLFSSRPGCCCWASHSQQKPLVKLPQRRLPSL